jgi:hypothetical protein
MQPAFYQTDLNWFLLNFFASKAKITILYGYLKTVDYVTL